MTGGIASSRADEDTRAAVQDALADRDAIMCDGIGAQEIVHPSTGENRYALVFWQDQGPNPGNSVVVFSKELLADVAQVIVRIGLHERARANQPAGA